jgi:hypothetical protein
MQAYQSITARRASFSLAAHAHKAVKKQRVSSSVVRAAQEIIATDAAPKAVGPYSQGIKVRRCDFWIGFHFFFISPSLSRERESWSR